MIRGASPRKIFGVSWRLEGVAVESILANLWLEELDNKRPTQKTSEASNPIDSILDISFQKKNQRFFPVNLAY